MKTKSIITLAILLLTAESILIGLKRRNTRCMVEFIVGSGLVNTVKIKIQFPELQNEVSGEHFYFSIRNTQTNKTQQKPMKPGTKYIKEQQFQENVIYELCITFRTERDIQAFVDYETQSHYNYKQEVVKVPDNLLTKSDFREAFVSASYLRNIIAEFNSQHAVRKKVEYKQFEITEQMNSYLTTTSFMEFLILAAANLCQFLYLKKYLSTKQYI